MTLEGDPHQQTGGLIGRTIAGRYRVERRIARGGMGVVYVATHLRLQRPVVFKVLSEHLEDDEKASARFEQEALGLSRLNHPNIVTVHDFGVEDGVTYIVMEYVPGLTLSDVLRRDGVMTFERFLPLGAQIIEAIGAAHQKEIVHRDIKPANIMIVSEPGEPDLVKVLDFGLARLTSSSLDITKDNLVGTVSYVAPEVVKGSRAGKAADVYALGVLFYFLLTGRKPFKAEDDLSVLYKHVHDAPTPMSELLPAASDVPAEFVDLIARCLDKEPSRRPADGRELLEALEDLVALPHRSRIASGEYRPAPRTEANDRVTKAGPVEPGVVPSSTPGSGSHPDLSFELSSMALRERPNSRWGIPLIALCVFAAGVAAIVLLRPSGAEDVPDSELVESADAPGAAEEESAPAGKENESASEPAFEPEPQPEPQPEDVVLTDEKSSERGVAGSKTPKALDAKRAPRVERRDSPGRRASKRESDPEKLVEAPSGAEASEASTDQASDDPTTRSVGSPQHVDDEPEAPLFAPEETDSQLLRVDDSDDEVLLPVD